ncbi:hypothetical protein M8494_23815 [Serratia ureilytica]
MADETTLAELRADRTDERLGDRRARQRCGQHGAVRSHPAVADLRWRSSAS